MDRLLSDSLNTEDLLFWVSQLRDGRPDEAEPTFRRILSRVRAFAGKAFGSFPRVGRFVEVDDVIQSALVRLLRAMRDIRPTSTRHFYALANELIRRELLDLTKHFYGPRGAGTNLASVPVGEGPGKHAPADPRDPLDAELDRMAAFHEAVAVLPAGEREVIGLTYYHGWPQAEIADLLGVTVRTVQRWYAAGTEALRGKLGEVPAGGGQSAARRMR